MIEATALSFSTAEDYSTTAIWWPMVHDVIELSPLWYGTSYQFCILAKESRMLAFECIQAWVESKHELNYWYDTITGVNSLPCVSTSFLIDCNHPYSLTVQRSWFVKSQIFCHICPIELNSVSNAFLLSALYHAPQCSPPTRTLEASRVEYYLVSCQLCSFYTIIVACSIILMWTSAFVLDKSSRISTARRDGGNIFNHISVLVAVKRRPEEA